MAGRDQVLDFAAAETTLLTAGLEDWWQELRARIAARVSASAHGDCPRWQAALDSLPEVPSVTAELDVDTITVEPPTWDAAISRCTRAAFRELIPWRKGPFRIGDVLIDSEWRSNLKWQRIAAAIEPLEGRLVLDVGSGNGYYALRMRGAGARAVVGIDPTLVYLAQFRAITHFLNPEPVTVLPLRLEELPGCTSRFDTVFSMGVLYHQRAPLEHLRQLRGALRSGGELLLETLVLPGDAPFSHTPAERYARMRNVWHLPTVAELRIWLTRSGFRRVRLVDISVTTTEEQRRTEWMPFESLAEALDPATPSATVEGMPAPRRAVLIARRPG